MTIFQDLLFLTAVFCFWLSLFVLRKQKAPGRMELSFLLAIIGTWCFTAALESIAVQLDVKLFWSTILYAAATIAPLLFFLFALRHTEQDKWLSPRVLIVFWFLPVITLVLLLTNTWHLISGQDMSRFEHLTHFMTLPHSSPVFWIMLAYTYALVLGGFALLFHAVFRYPYLYEKVTKWVLVCAILPWAANLVYIFLPNLLGIEITAAPLIFAFSGAFLALGVYQYQLPDIIPLGRDILFEYLRDAVVIVDTNQQIVDINRAALSCFNESESIIGNKADKLFEDFGIIESLLLGASRKGPGEVALEAKCGSFEVSCIPLFDRNKVLMGHQIILHDITERKKTEAALQDSEERYRVLVEHANEAIIVVQDGLMKFSNNITAVFTGYEPDEIASVSIASFVIEEDIGRVADHFDQLLTGKRYEVKFEFRFRDKTGNIRWGEANAVKIMWAGAPAILNFVDDITDRKNLERELSDKSKLLAEANRLLYQKSISDSLTGLSNHHHIFELLQFEISRRSRYYSPLSIMMIDIDHFKSINDTHGHLQGDEVLRSVASTIQQSLRKVDKAGRYGGEEFLVILPHTPLEGATEAAERIRERVEKLDFPKDINLTVSIGVAECDDHTTESLVQHADSCLYRAKQLGRNQVTSTMQL